MSDGMALPTRGLTFPLDTDADSVPCCECKDEVPAEFEEDPDGDAGQMVPESTCPECGEPWCARCRRKSDEDACAVCIAATDTTERTESVRANQQPLGYEPEPSHD